MQNNPTRVTHGRCQAEGTMQMPSPCMQHLGRSSLALNVPLHHSRLLMCLCSAQIQQLKSVVLWWVLCSAFIPSQLMSSGISEQPALPSSPCPPPCLLLPQERVLLTAVSPWIKDSGDRLGLLWDISRVSPGLISPSVPGSTDLLRSWPAAGDAEPCRNHVQPLGSVQRAGIQPSQSQQRNLPSLNAEQERKEVRGLLNGKRGNKHGK